jgi:hypothetical protein
MKLSRATYPDVYKVSKATGIPPTTLWNIRIRRTKIPRYDTVQKLAAFYRRKAA